jgi:hypothetical protein
VPSTATMADPVPVVACPVLYPILPIILILQRSAITTSTRIKLISIFIPDLSSTLASSVLSSFHEPFVEIGTDDALVEFCAANVFHAVESVLVGVVFDEAETAGGLLETVESHYQAFYFTAPMNSS